jgi:hypothetical protein
MIELVKFVDFDMNGILFQYLITGIVLEIENRPDTTMGSQPIKMIGAVRMLLQSAARVFAFYRAACAL